MALADEKYMLFTSFRRNGQPVATPVWLAELPSGAIGFHTGSGSGKAKRLAHTPRVTVQACDSRGKSLHGEVFEGTARVVSGAEAEPVHAAIRAKYGFMVVVTGFMVSAFMRLKRQPFKYADAAVIVTLSGASPG